MQGIFSTLAAGWFVVSSLWVYRRQFSFSMLEPSSIVMRVRSVVAIAFVAVTGCTNKDEPSSLSVKTSTATVYESGAGAETIIWDLGVVPPGSSHSHTFKIPNSTADEWIVKELRSSCSCTVPRINKNCINPGEKLEVDVKYVAGKSVRDENLAVAVLFEKSTSHKLLQVKSRVRPAIAIEPAELQWSIVAPNQPLKGVVYIYNYSKLPWERVSVGCKDSWVNTDIECLFKSDEDDGTPREKWRCSVTISPQELPLGVHETELKIEPAAAVSIGIQSLPITFESRHAFAAVPSTLFFGEVQLKGTASATTDLVWQLSDGDFKLIQSPKCRHDLADSFQVDIRRGKNGHWCLHGTITPSKVGKVRGNVIVDFGVEWLPEMVVPVSAFVAKELSR